MTEVIFENECFRFERYENSAGVSIYDIISQEEALSAGITIGLEPNTYDSSKQAKYVNIEVQYNKLPPVNPFDGLGARIKAELAAQDMSFRVVKYLKEHDLWEK